LIILVSAAAVIFMVLGYSMAPLIQSKLQERGRTHLQTVLASNQPPKSETSSAAPSANSPLETVTFDQLQQMAQKGDPAAENALGLRYAAGEGVKLDEKEAVRWFTKAAEQGNVAAQSKLGFLYWSGRGVPKDISEAYLWTVVASLDASNVKDPAVLLSRDLAPVLRNQLTRAQATIIEQQATLWLQKHDPNTKPPAGR
jgi:hypothetical protein